MSPRLHQAQEPIDEEEEHRTHDLAYMVPVNMEGVECEEDEIQVVHAVECVEVARSDIGQRCQPHCNPCQERHDARNLGNPCVFPLSQLHKSRGWIRSNLVPKLTFLDFLNF